MKNLALFVAITFAWVCPYIIWYLVLYHYNWNIGGMYKSAFIFLWGLTVLSNLIGVFLYIEHKRSNYILSDDNDKFIRSMADMDRPE